MRNDLPNSPIDIRAAINVVRINCDLKPGRKCLWLKDAGHFFVSRLYNFVLMKQICLASSRQQDNYCYTLVSPAMHLCFFMQIQHVYTSNTSDVYSRSYTFLVYLIYFLNIVQSVKKAFYNCM